ncbi:DUF2017 family protein [Streptomyces sp. SCUT-3]|uniref:DUF2017 domain-containing protein n=1 Tax=Streptomyces sp. SCUT-3 TaxID=2684469 RepID=UPI000CAF1EB1|nr:DUF2017 domain-containing protein [Streptomyces sp. SCUT-3]PLW74465.1 DUF2017 domain-containing protein [Streptomyces sp. DJ]QMV23265.1 DUF2017 family protein [Streptomyces sp. SCUT-3]
MAGYFEAAPDGAAVIALDEVEVSILRSLAVQLLELIGPGREHEEGADPLAALFAEGPSSPPSDPALARLFPDAYVDPQAGDAAGREAREASAEFRRYTENDLRARKREDALAVVRDLDGLEPSGGGAVLRVAGDDARHWLGTLNDLRLTIGSRLGVTEDDEELYRLPDTDPRKPLVMAYLWLGGLQESLLETLM